MTREFSDIQEIDHLNHQMPPPVRQRFAECGMEHVAARGNTRVLEQRLLAFFCSFQCPGNLILETYDLARELRKAGVGVIGGFHSPMEKECLELLLRGSQPVIICPAREIYRMRVPKLWKEPLQAGRLLILSPFAENQRRMTAELALQRNRFVAQLADEVFAAHAAAGSKTLSFCRELLGADKPVLTIQRPENSTLLELGAEPLAVKNASTRWPFHPKEAKPDRKVKR